MSVQSAYRLVTKHERQNQDE